MDVSISDSHKFFLDKARTSLKDQLKKNEDNYGVQIQVAKYFKQTENYKKKVCITTATYDDEDLQIYFIYGNNIPEASSKQDYESFKADFINTLHPRINKFYSIVFFNTNQMTASALNDFKEFYATLPSRYFTQLQDFIVVHANLLVKSGGIFLSNDFQRFFKKLITYRDSIFVLSKESWFKYRMLQAVDTSIKIYDSSYKDVEMLRKQTVLKRQKTQQPIGDDDLGEDNFNKESRILGMFLHEYSRNNNGLPDILDILVQYFQNKESTMLTEGLFRKQSAVYEEQVLEAALACNKVSFVAKVENPHIVACVFKQFFLKLKEPLINYQLYDYLVTQYSQHTNFELKDKAEQISIIMSQLSPLSQLVLGFSMQFFARIVEFQQSNLMTSYNMAVVFGPSFFRSQTVSMADMQYINTFIQLVQYMIDHAKTLFPLDYKQLLVRRHIEAFDASMLPFLDETNANLEDIMDMIGETHQQQIE